MARLGVGVVGAGILGSRHARAFAEQPDTMLVAVADTDPRRQAVAEKFGVPFYANIEEMLERERGIEAVGIATPDHLHMGPTLKALEAGKHVFLEKPLATTEEDARAIVEAAARTSGAPAPGEGSGRVVAVNYSQRYVTDHRWIEEMVRGGQIGTAQMVISVKFDTMFVPTKMIADWATKTSPIFFMSSHDLDLVCCWLDDRPVEAFAYEASGTLKERGLEVHDGLNAVLKFGGGATAAFHTSWIHPSTYPKVADGTLQIIGSRGAITYHARTRSAEMFNENGGQKVEFTGPHTADEVDGKISGAFVESLRRFVRCVLTGEQPETSPRRTLPVTLTQTAIMRSLRSRRPEAIPKEG